MLDDLSFTDAVEVSAGRGAHLHEPVTLEGHVLVELFGPDGQLKETREVDNLVVDAGKAHIADRLSTTPGQAAMGWMAIGTGATAPAAANTLLGTEIDRNALTSATDAANVVTYVGDWAAGDGTNSAIAEAGIFNIVTANTVTMLARATFTAINKGASDTLKITWTVTVG
jgi:hypothetical protein